MPGTVPSVSHKVTHLLFTTTTGDKYNSYPYFTGGEKLIQRDVKQPPPNAGGARI